MKKLIQQELDAKGWREMKCIIVCFYGIIMLVVVCL